jgi:hypothetical protein
VTMRTPCIENFPIVDLFEGHFSRKAELLTRGLEIVPVSRLMKEY